MKRVLKKLLIIILIVFIFNNFLISSFTNVSYAFDFEGALNTILGSVIGIFLWIPRIIAVGIGYAIDGLEGTVAFAEGKIESGEIVRSTGITGLTPLDILFNKVAITDINFFKVSAGSGTGVISNSIIYEIRSNIAVWYYIMRNIAAAILLVVLIYLGIRMAITTVASDKALYKKMLVDWACSLALIFLLQYIAVFIINLNEALVKVIEGAGGVNPDDLKNMINELGLMSLSPIGIESIAAAVVFCMIVIQTFALFLSYFSRMLKLAFLLIISPLITLTYALDKIGDGKAQALGNWLREFTFTVLIQPFHCIIYIVFISMAVDIIRRRFKEYNGRCNCCYFMFEIYERSRENS